MPPLSTDYVFMSYSRRDDAVMRRIVAFLREQGIKVWVDNEKLIPGTPVWEKEIEKAVQGASAVVVVLSPDSKDSEWVRREISLADQYEKRVFPLLVRGDEKTSISIRLIGRQYVDIRSNEDAGLNYVSATLLRYLEELNEREQNAKKEADRLAAQKIKAEKRLAARKAEEERIALERVIAERKAREDADRLSAQNGDEERIANEKAEADRKAKEDANRFAAQKVEEERIALEKVIAERKAKEELDRLSAQKADEERIAVEKVVADRKAKEDSDRLTAQKAEEERIALEKIVADRKAKEDAEHLAAQKAELDSKEKLAREKVEREAAGKVAREILEKPAAKSLPFVENKNERVNITVPNNNLRWLGIGGMILFVLICGGFGLNYLIKNLPATTAISSPTVVFATISSSTFTPMIEQPTSTSKPLISTPQSTEAPIPVPTLGIGSTMVGEKGETLVYVPAGEFTMEDYGVLSPFHTVYLNAFWIDQTEVTNKQYKACVDTGICEPPSSTISTTHPNYYGNPEFDDYPVVYVSWDKANRYCEVWTGGDLPTEAQWEKAARGIIDARTYPWGEAAPSKGLLNYNQNIGDTTMVKNYPNTGSFYGTYDMAGNVWEWVNDWYSDTYYKNSNSFNNPLGPESGTSRVSRGGSWIDIYQYIRSAYRGSFDPATSDNSIGFRCSHGTSP